MYAVSSTCRRPFPTTHASADAQDGASLVELRDLQDVDTITARLGRSERLPCHRKAEPRNDEQVLNEPVLIRAATSSPPSLK